MSAPQPSVDLAQPPWAAPGSDAAECTPLAPAGFWRRAFAFLIDLALVSLLLQVGKLLGRPLEGWPVVKHAFELTVWLVVPAAYFVLLHGTWGRTAGKAVAGVRVVTASGEPLGYARALARHLAWFLSALPLLVGLLMVAARNDKRALHDLIAGTRVVRVR